MLFAGGVLLSVLHSVLFQLTGINQVGVANDLVVLEPRECRDGTGLTFVSYRYDPYVLKC